MANVVFKRGTLTSFQTNLGRDASTNRWKQFADGTIYITTDESDNGGALYMDYLDPDTTKTALQREHRIRIGDTVQISSSWTAFQSANKAHDAIYYIVSDNILCAWNPEGGPSHTGAWQQINAQKTISEYFNNLDLITENANLTISDDQQVSSILFTQDLKLGDESVLDTEHYALPQYAFINSETASFTLGQGTTSSSQQIPTVQVNAEKDLAAVKLTAGTNAVSIETSTNRTLNGTRIGNSNVVGGTVTIAGSGGTMISLPNSANQSDTGTITITTAQEGYLDVDNGTLQTTWYAGHGASGMSGDALMTGQKICPKIAYGGDSSNLSYATASESVESASVYGPNRKSTLTWTLDVYTKNEIDNRFKAVNSMTFLGVLYEDDLDEDTHNFPTTDIKIGDTYAIGEAISIQNQGFYRPGDLIIAVPKVTNGVAAQEDANGYLPANGVQWQQVETGRDEAADYSFDHDGNTLQLLMNQISHGDIYFDTNYFTVRTPLPADNSTADIIIEHAKSEGPTITTGAAINVTESDQEGIYTASTPVITGLTLDSANHVVAYTVSTLNIVDTRKGISSYTNSADFKQYKTAQDHKRVDLVSELTLSDSSTVDLKYALVSDTLIFKTASVTDTDSNRPVVSIDLEWGSFQ